MPTCSNCNAEVLETDNVCFQCGSPLKITNIPQKGVTLRSIKKIFGEDTLVLQNINLDIQDKEFLVLVGPSGCGKSTLLRIIAGLEFPTTGDIFINGQWVNRIPPKDRNIAFVFQSYALYPHMNVYDNISFSLRMKKMDKNLIMEKVTHAANVLGIESQLNKKPAQLSGGQRQRVALGRAIVRDPQVFLLDEPLSNLDAKLRSDMRKEIIHLQRQLGVTMIYVTHDQVEAMTMGDRIVVLYNGIIQQIGTPIDLYENPANKFVSGFIGTPTMNYLQYKLKNADQNYVLVSNVSNVQINEDQAQILLQSNPDGDFILGFRPEDLKIIPNELESSFKAIIDVIEPLGSNTHITFTLENGTNLTASLSGMFIGRELDNVFLQFDRKKIHIFDAKTEKTILHGLN